MVASGDAVAQITELFPKPDIFYNDFLLLYCQKFFPVLIKRLLPQSALISLAVVELPYLSRADFIICLLPVFFFTASFNRVKIMYETGPFNYALAKILKLNLPKVNVRFIIEGFQV